MNKALADWRKGLVLLKAPLIAVALLVTSEWLFFATKPSFMSGLGYLDKLRIWIVATVFSLLAIYLGLRLAGLLLGWLGEAGLSWYRRLVALANTLLVTCLLVLLVDNFTYSVFEVGIRSIESAGISALGVLLILAGMAWVFRASLGSLAFPSPPTLTARLLGLAVVGALATGLLNRGHEAVDSTPAAVPQRPNILIIGADALEAQHMSAYGYARDTTPFLASARDQFLVATHSFTNNSASFGSIGSMLTGKYPATTRLVYPPNVLTGRDQFEHLPGLLKNQGYRTLDMSLRWYTEARDMNLRCGFDAANFRAITDCDRMSRWLRGAMERFGGAFLLFDQLRDRISERLELLNPWVENPTLDKDLSRVGQPQDYWHRDDERFSEALKFIAADDPRPFLVNLHLMGTHGGKPMLESRRFSAGKALDSFWDIDFYDDAVLRLDGQLADLFEQMEALGQLDRTVIVITSDHGKNWDITARLPLMFRFPNGAHAGVLPGNTQRLDIAPTLLSYMGRQVPAWMEGDPLIGPDVPDLFARPVIQVSPPGGEARQRAGRVMLGRMLPPFYSVGTVHIISCDYQFSWVLKPNRWKSERIARRPRECNGKTITRVADYVTLAREHLGARGYDLSGVGNPAAMAGSGQP